MKSNIITSACFLGPGLGYSKSIKQLLFAIFFALLLIGCKKEIPENTSPITEEVKSNETKSDKPKEECYSYNAKGSVISLQLHYNENNVSGSLTYALKEKDSNTGFFTGTIKNNILVADYTFQSEGTESTRQVAFQFKDGKVFEGYGDMNQEGTRFKDATKLNFDSTMPLDKTICPE